MKCFGSVVLGGLLLAGCGKDTPAAPTPAPTRVIQLGGNLQFGPVPLFVTATGLITITNTGTATLTFTNIGLTCPTNFTASSSSGTVAPGATVSITLQFTPTIVQNCSGPILVTGDQTSGTNTINVNASGTLTGVPIFSRSGSGNGSFTVPNYVTRLRIDANYTGPCQNFMVGLSTQAPSLINITMGQCAIPSVSTQFSNVFDVPNAGVVTVTSPATLLWTFTEVR